MAYQPFSFENSIKVPSSISFDKLWRELGVPSTQTNGHSLDVLAKPIVHSDITNTTAVNATSSNGKSTSEKTAVTAAKPKRRRKKSIPTRPNGTAEATIDTSNAKDQSPKTAKVSNGKPSTTVKTKERASNNPQPQAKASKTTRVNKKTARKATSTRTAKRAQNSRKLTQLRNVSKRGTQPRGKATSTPSNKRGGRKQGSASLSTTHINDPTTNRRSTAKKNTRTAKPATQSRSRKRTPQPKRNFKTASARKLTEPNNDNNNSASKSANNQEPSTPLSLPIKKRCRALRIPEPKTEITETFERGGEESNKSDIEVEGGVPSETTNTSNEAEKRVSLCEEFDMLSQTDQLEHLNVGSHVVYEKGVIVRRSTRAHAQPSKPSAKRKRKIKETKGTHSKKQTHKKARTMGPVKEPVSKRQRAKEQKDADQQEPKGMELDKCTLDLSTFLADGGIVEIQHTNKQQKNIANLQRQVSALMKEVAQTKEIFLQQRQDP